MPSRFNVGRVARKARQTRTEVTTTVASQLVDPECTFSKPASRSYSRRHVTGGHSTLDQTTLGSEACSHTESAAETHSKPRRHRKKDKEFEEELEQWAASMNSQLSEVDDFELVVERA